MPFSISTLIGLPPASRGASLAAMQHGAAIVCGVPDLSHNQDKSGWTIITIGNCRTVPGSCGAASETMAGIAAPGPHSCYGCTGLRRHRAAGENVSSTEVNVKLYPKCQAASAVPGFPARALRPGAALLAVLASLSCRAELPAALGEACGACHGAGGVAAQAQTPHLNGQLAGYLADAMAAFVAGRRVTAVAAHKTLAPEQIEAAAQHYAGQADTARPRQELDTAQVSRGAGVYDRRCYDCHLDGGRDSKDGAPLLAGQDKDFLTAQSLLFQSGARKFPYMMDGAFRGLSDEELAAVANYFAAQEPAPPPGQKKKRRRQ